MSNKAKFYVYIILSLVLGSIIIQPIIQHSITLQSGELFLFPTAPVDPYDPFRGKYVQLSFQQTTAPLDISEPTIRKQKTVYGILSKKSDGTAEIRSIVYSRPKDKPYLSIPLEKYQMYYHDSSRVVDYSFPFDRFYMNEKLAPIAEQIYRENQRDSSRALLAVRIKDGHGTIEDLLIDGQPIFKLSKERLEGKTTQK